MARTKKTTGHLLPKRRTGPVKLFISYASEDYGLAREIKAAFDRLRELSDGNIFCDLDVKTFGIGTPEPLMTEISKKLFDTDFLVVVYTGVRKRSISYPGAELGIFWGLIKADEEYFGSSDRKIIPINFGQQPPVEYGQLAVFIDIAPSELQLSREAYRESVLKELHGGKRYSALDSALKTVGEAADVRLPKATRKNYSAAAWDERNKKRSDEISKNVIPDLMTGFHGLFRVRVKRNIVEQRGIEFKIASSQSVQGTFDALPDETMLAECGHAFALFGNNSTDGSTNWKDFKEELKNKERGEWIISSIQRSVITAISPDLARDDEQMMRDCVQNQLYRVIVTDQFEFFDGSKVINVLFIPALQVFNEDSNAAIVLAFIDVAVKFRERFLKSKGEFSVAAFHRQFTLDALKDKVRNLISEINALRDELRVLGLDNKAVVLFGDSKEAQDLVLEMSRKADDAMAALFKEADGILQLTSGATTDDVRRGQDSWTEFLDKFYNIISEMNYSSLQTAIDNLKKYI